MKRFNSLKGWTVGAMSLLAVISLDSCLKNGQFYTDFASAASSVELPLAASTSNGITAFAYPPSVTSVTLPVYVNVASVNPPGSSTTVSLAKDTAGLSAYNAANGTNYQPIPDSAYSISSWNLTIPAGKRLDSVNVTIQLSKLNLANAYVFPVTIKTASLPIEQWNHLFYYVAVKNQWDGVYGFKGYTLRAGDAARTGNFVGQQMTLLTSGSNSVNFATLQLWADLSGVGIGNPQLTIDGSNNVTIASSGGAFNAPGYASHYDPGTRTFYISFSWGAGPAARLATDTLTYLHPR
jgi:hypothetical protein